MQHGQPGFAKLSIETVSFHNHFALTTFWLTIFNSGKETTMAVMDITRGNDFPRIGTYFNPIRSIVERFHRYNAYRQTFNELNKLKDKDLYDIGITRLDIVEVSRKAAAR